MLPLLLLACPADTPEPVVAPAPPVTEPVAEPAPAPPDPTPLPPGVPWTGEPIALIGHGIRLTLNPPFQAAWMGSMEGEGSMVVAWWDVNAERAGVSGAAGLYNVAIHAAPVPEGSPAIRRTTTVHRGQTRYALQLGETGTLLELPEGHDALGGMGTVEPGPADPTWRVQVGDAEPMSWPDRDMLHSWDPADGGPARFIQRPSRPWGPWPTGE
jgi:hypothetical protein